MPDRERFECRWVCWEEMRRILRDAPMCPLCTERVGAMGHECRGLEVMAQHVKWDDWKDGYEAARRAGDV